MVLPISNSSTLCMTTWDKCSDGKYYRICHCKTLCTQSTSDNMIYVYPEKNLCAYPDVICGTDEWNNTYKNRTTVERDINHINETLCLSGWRTQNKKIVHADLLLADITQLITVVFPDKIKHLKYIRSLKPLIA